MPRVSGRLISAKITGAIPYTGASVDEKQFLSRIQGIQALIKLGTLGKDEPLPMLGAGNTLLVYCNDIDFTETPGNFANAHCFGKGWGGVLKFEALGPGKEMLVDLGTSIDGEVARGQTDYRLYQVFDYPLFIYLFLLLSLLAFLASRAIRFVKNG
jgi:hypothetical protein